MNRSSNNKYVVALLTMNFINVFGSILTLLANSMFLLDLGGSSSVTAMFFLKAIPPIFVGTYIAKRISNKNRLPVAALGMAAAAINVWFLFFRQSEAAILLFAFIASLVNSSSGMLITSVTSDIFTGEKLKSIFRRQSAINCGLFAIAPAIGGWIAQRFGIKILYFMDGLTFWISAGLALYCQMQVTLHGAEKKHTVRESKANPSTVVFPPAFLALIAFAIAGSFLDSIEFPILGLRVDRNGVGLVLAAWGLGSALMFFIPHRLSRHLTTEMAGFGFLVGCLCFVLSGELLGMCVGFFIAGAAQVIVNGNLKTQLREQYPGESSQELWARLNRYIALVTLACFGIFTGLFLYFSVSRLAVLVPIACLIFLVILWKQKEAKHVPIATK